MSPLPTQPLVDPQVEIDHTVEQIREMRAEIDDRVGKLHELSTRLRTQAMRSGDESTSSLVNFANAHMRIAGAVSTGMRRTTAMDRVLQRAKDEQGQVRERAEREETRRLQVARQHEQAKQIAKLQTPMDDDLEQLFGEVTRA